MESYAKRKGAKELRRVRIKLQAEKVPLSGMQIVGGRQISAPFGAETVQSTVCTIAILVVFGPLLPPDS